VTVDLTPARELFALTPTELEARLAEGRRLLGPQ